MNPSRLPQPINYGEITTLGGLVPLQRQWSGYVNVSSSTSAFYHYVESTNKSAPLLIWTNGTIICPELMLASCCRPAAAAASPHAHDR